MARTTKPDVKKETTQVPAPEVKKAASEVMTSRTAGKVLIANQHAGVIVLPRKPTGAVVIQPISLPPGRVTPVDADVWADMKKNNRMVQAYLDHRLLAEVSSAGDGSAHVTSVTSSSPIVPPHLQSEKEAGQYASAQVTKQDVAQIEV